MRDDRNSCRGLGQSRSIGRGFTLAGARRNGQRRGVASLSGRQGANQALAACRLGAHVKLVACVGNDATATEALALLHEGGVDLAHCVIDDGAPTGVALISVAPSGENSIVVAPGANAELSRDQFELPSADALICQLEVPRETISEVVAEFLGFVCVNLAPARDVDDALLQR